MRQAIVLAVCMAGALASRPFFNEPDTGLLDAIGYDSPPSRYSSLKMEEIAAGAQANQTLFAQLKLSNDDANQKAIPLIILSNHGGRNLDGSPSPPEVALEIYEKDPSIFHEPRF
ncbi:cytochrome mitochondrial precursor [Seiridium cupressi]